MKTKKGEIVSSKMVALILGVLILAGVLMFLFKADINNYLRNLPGYHYDENDKDAETPKDVGVEIKNPSPCELNKNTCQVLSESCYCLDKATITSFINSPKEKIDFSKLTCAKYSFCYNGGDGCKTNLGEWVFFQSYISDCKKTNPNFKSVPLCKVDLNNFKVNVIDLCSCPKENELKAITIPYKEGDNFNSYFSSLEKLLSEGKVVFSLCTPGSICNFGTDGCD